MWCERGDSRPANSEACTRTHLHLHVVEGKNEVGSVLQHASVAVASVGGACGRGGGGLGLGQSWDRVLRRQQHDAEEGVAVQNFEMQRRPR